MTNDARDLILQLRAHFSQYHHHKEQMAYGAATIYVGGAIALLLLKDPDWFEFMATDMKWLWIVITGLCGGLYVFWQLRQRQFAAEVVSACTLLLVRWLTVEPIRADLVPTDCKEFGQVWPQCLCDKLVEVRIQRGWRQGPFISAALTLVVMIMWGLAVVARLVCVPCQ